jgi:CRP-like cAMP-binding protein
MDAQDAQEDIVRLLVAQLRRDSESQADLIRELRQAGLRPARIAELLGTSQGTVSVTLAKAKQREVRKKAKPTGGSKT